MGHRVTRCFILSYRTSICYGITYLDLDLTGDDESYLSRDNGRGEIRLEVIYRSSLVRASFEKYYSKYRLIYLKEAI